MQIHEEHLCGASRPCAPSDCARCNGAQKLHAHGSYLRNADCTGDEKVVSLRFLCPRCGATFGVIPRGMLPYRCLPVERLEAWMDDGHCVAAPAAGGGARPPPASEVERGCLERAQENLLQRIPFLSGLLGQRLPLLACGDRSPLPPSKSSPKGIRARDSNPPWGLQPRSGFGYRTPVNIPKSPAPNLPKHPLPPHFISVKTPVGISKRYNTTPTTG